MATVEREARAAVANNGREARGHGDSSRAHLDSMCPWPARDGRDIHAVDIGPETCCDLLMGPQQLHRV